MNANITIKTATPGDSHEIAVMVGELLSEIMNTIGVQAFNFDLGETTDRLRDFLNHENTSYLSLTMKAKKQSGSLPCMKATPFTLKALLEP